MKKYIIASCVSAAALVTKVSAHPGPPGHQHPEGDNWPFPPMEWNIAIVGATILAVAFAYKKMPK